MQAILTNKGQAKLANLRPNEALNLSYFELGTAEGAPEHFPNEDQEKLYSSKHKGPVNAVKINEAGQIEVQGFVHNVQAGFLAQEIGLFDEDETLIAVAKLPRSEFQKMPDIQAELIICLALDDQGSIECATSLPDILATKTYVDEGDEKTRRKLQNALDQKLSKQKIALESFAKTEDAKRLQTLEKAVLDKVKDQDQKTLSEAKKGWEEKVLALINELEKTFSDKDAELTHLIDTKWGPESYPHFADNICPIGSPLMWPSNQLPSGQWAFCQGQSFNKAQYPRLAKIYPSGKLPDLRGMVIKGASTSRAPLSYEADQIKSHKHASIMSNTDLGTKRTSSNGAHRHNITGVNFLPEHEGNLPLGDFKSGPQRNGPTSISGEHSHEVDLGSHSHKVQVLASGAAENTVKNIAMHFIVRMA